MIQKAKKKDLKPIERHTPSAIKAKKFGWLLRLPIFKQVFRKKQWPRGYEVEAGQILVVQLLLSKGAEVNAKMRWGETPLHVAAEKGHTHVANLLIVKGAEVNAKTLEGSTPLLLAKKTDRKDTVELLLKYGARE